MLQNGFFLTESHNPNLPPEEYDTLVYESNTPGSYSNTLGWGKYKIVISGAGGGGAACGWNSAHGTRYAENGKKGEEKTIYVEVLAHSVLTVSGIIGTGGEGGYARTEHTNINRGGYGRAGYQSGANGSNQLSYYQIPQDVISGSASGGGGGGSTSVEWNSTVQEVAAGGNGGNARHANYGIWGYGGTGGNGGASSGTGATGGTGYGAFSNSQLIGGTGTAGYVKIYKSNLMPEPL